MWEWWRGIGVRGDAACKKERLTSGVNIVIEGVPGISHAKIVRRGGRVKLTAWIPAFLTIDSSFYTPILLINFICLKYNLS